MTFRFNPRLQAYLPKHALTRFAGLVANARMGGVTTRIIQRFIRRYGVDMSEAQQPDPAAYPTFNEFFTRALRPEVRPLAKARLLCPVDGSVSQFGPIDGDRIIQAKGHDYSIAALLGETGPLVRHFTGGHFATLYLSPRDYHRIHMPCDGKLVSMRFVPGDLYSVNPATAAAVPGLFARNERLVCIFEGADGPASRFALVLVGATIVGSMATVWHGLVARRGQCNWHYDSRNIELKQGEEMGRFLLGSTVVLLFPPGRLAFNAQWTPQGTIRMGEMMAD